jgi:hypothetical protein
LGNKEEIDDYLNGWENPLGIMLKRLKLLTENEEEIEERNDVYIYQTLRYPPKSTPPTAT